MFEPFSSCLLALLGFFFYISNYIKSLIGMHSSGLGVPLFLGSCSIPMKKHSDEADGDGEGEDGGAATAGDKEGGGEQGGAVKPTSRENSTAAESTKSKSSSKLTSKDETTGNHLLHTCSDN